jgi:S1-C subfamily serine protease
VEIDGSPVVDVGELQALMTAARIGRAVSVKVVRGGEVRDVELRPTELGD